MNWQLRTCECVSFQLEHRPYTLGEWITHSNYDSDYSVGFLRRRRVTTALSKQMRLSRVSERIHTYHYAYWQWKWNWLIACSLAWSLMCAFDSPLPKVVEFCWCVQAFNKAMPWKWHTPAIFSFTFSTNVLAWKEQNESTRAKAWEFNWIEKVCALLDLALSHFSFTFLVTFFFFLALLNRYCLKIY